MQKQPSCCARGTPLVRLRHSSRPSGFRSRPISVVLGELAVAAGLVGESVTVAYDFPANTLCQIWKHYTQALGASNVIHARVKKDIKDFEARFTDIRAVFVYLQNSDDGHARYLQIGSIGEPIPGRNWKRLSARELARRLKGWSPKQVRTHFDRLQQRGLVTAERERANGPLRYQMPEELESVGSPYSQLPTVRS